jgi:hypothetical protein
MKTWGERRGGTDDDDDDDDERILNIDRLGLWSW